MVNAVICEFDPFHNGHKYLIDTARERTGAEYTVCFMSGNFVQRGFTAICDKHRRAATAVKNGADIVFQIPTAHTLANASVFANAGVYMASALGVPTSLVFGTEANDITPLFKLALTDTVKLAKNFKESISTGISYGEAVMEAYRKSGADDTEILKNPNNLLAFEYIKAVIKQKSDIKVINIPRVGTEHNSDASSGTYASASFIRENIQSADMSAFMPEGVIPAIDRDRLNTAVMYAVRSKSVTELEKYADMTEGIASRFAKASAMANTVDELCSLVKCKRYTHAKIRRASMNVLIGTPAGLYKQNPPYLKVLAFNDNGRQLLKKLSETARLPIITKPSDAQYIQDGKEHFALECQATDIYDICSVTHRGGGREYTVSPIYLK